MSEQVYTAADVRPIADVIADCRKVIVRRLPGNRMVQATWSALNRAAEAVDMARSALDSPHEEGDRLYRATCAGEHYVGAMVVRGIADALDVPNFRDDGWDDIPPNAGSAS